MKIKILCIILLISIFGNAQNAADIDQVLGTNYRGFNRVDDIVVQPDGKTIVGGIFCYGQNNSAPQGHIVRFNIDGSIDQSFQAVETETLSSIINMSLQTDGKVLIAAYFMVPGGGANGNMIRLNTDGSLDNTFSNPIYGTIRTIALQPDNKIIVGGSFNVVVNGNYQRAIARLNTDGSVDTTFAYGVSGFTSSAIVNKVALQEDGKILAAGGFGPFNGINQGLIMRFNSNGTKDTTFENGSGASGNNLTEIVVQPDGKILVSGVISSFNGRPGAIHRLNSNGSIDLSFTFSLTSFMIYNIALRPNGNMVITGNITVNGVNHRFVELNNDGSVYDSFLDRQTNESLACIKLQTDGKILIGGYMNIVGGVMKNSYARLNSDGYLDTTFNLDTGLNDQVQTIALKSSGKTLIGGNFTRFEGLPQNGLICINDDGSKDSTFTIGTGFDGSVKVIVMQSDGKILIGGNFTSYNGSPANRIIRLNNDGSKDLSFNPGAGFNNSVSAIALQSDGKILIGGNFTSFDDQQQKFCIRLNTDGTKDSNFCSADAFGDRVTKIVVTSNGQIIVGGNFKTFGGNAQRFLVSLNSDGTKNESFNIGSGFGSNFSDDFVFDIVRDIAIQNDKLLIAGMSSFYQGLKLGTLFRINFDGLADQTFNSVVFGNGLLNTIAVQNDGKIVVGGSFSDINSGYQNQKRIVRLNSNGGKDSSFDIYEELDTTAGGFYNGAVNCIILQPDSKIWVGGSFLHYKCTSSFSAIRLQGDSFLTVDDNAFVPNEIVLFPNPVRNILNINKNVKSLKITEITGKVLAVKENVTQVDFSIYPQGLYFLTIENESGFIETKKVIKQ